MSRLSVLFATLMTGALASPASAHEGHGDPQYWHSFLHYLLEPIHAVAWGGVVLIAVGVLVIRARRSGGETR